MPKTTNSFIEEKMKEFAERFTTGVKNPDYDDLYENRNWDFPKGLSDREQIENVEEFMEQVILESEKRVREETVREIWKMVENEERYFAGRKGFEHVLDTLTRKFDEYASSKGINL